MYPTTKKFFIMALIIIMTCIGFYSGFIWSKQHISTTVYPKTGRIVYIDNDIMLIDDYAGNRWIWEGTDSWHEGDVISILFDNNKTTDITDDIILQLHFEYWDGE